MFMSVVVVVVVANELVLAPRALLVVMLVAVVEGSRPRFLWRRFAYQPSGPGRRDHFIILLPFFVVALLGGLLGIGFDRIDIGEEVAHLGHRSYGSICPSPERGEDFVGVGDEFSERSFGGDDDGVLGFPGGVHLFEFSDRSNEWSKAVRASR